MIVFLHTHIHTQVFNLTARGRVLWQVRATVMSERRRWDVMVTAETITALRSSLNPRSIYSDVFSVCVITDFYNFPNPTLLFGSFWIRWVFFFFWRWFVSSLILWLFCITFTNSVETADWIQTIWQRQKDEMHQGQKRVVQQLKKIYSSDDQLAARGPHPAHWTLKPGPWLDSKIVWIKEKKTKTKISWTVNFFGGAFFKILLQNWRPNSISSLNLTLLESSRGPFWTVWWARFGLRAFSWESHTQWY